MFTGYKPSPAIIFPSMGSVVSHEYGPRNNLPPYVCVPTLPTNFAGSGYLSFRIAPHVGPNGKVLAVDIQPEMLALIRQRMKQRNITNVEPVMGTVSDPKLPEGKVDTILMVDVYHEFSHPYEMTAAMVKALKTGGRLVFIEYRLEDEAVPIKLVHKMSEKQVVKEMTPFPLKHVTTHGGLPWQHVIIFERKVVEKK